MHYFMLRIGSQRMTFPILDPYCTKSTPAGWDHAILEEVSKDGKRTFLGSVKTSDLERNDA